MILNIREECDLGKARQVHQTQWKRVLRDFYEFTMSLHNNSFVYMPQQARSHWYACVCSKRHYHKRKPGYRRIVNIHISTRVLHTPPWTPQHIACATRVRQGWAHHYGHD